MKSVFNFMVTPKHSRSSSKKEIDGKELLLNTEVQNHQYTSRHGIVTALPIAEPTDINVGDEVIIHHNVFRRFRDIKGNEKNSKAYYNEKQFFVQPDQVYAYKRGGEWMCVNGFCFVKPIKSKSKLSIENEEPLKGIVKYSSDKSYEGNLIGFAPSSEYEFNIEGERLYRVPLKRITIKYEYQGDEEEYNPSWSQSS
tara:strand:- start:289 stop:879 length:591 start_codon:yes stop_codon:yes gene_type:complete